MPHCELCSVTSKVENMIHLAGFKHCPECGKSLIHPTTIESLDRICNELERRVSDLEDRLSPAKSDVYKSDVTNAVEILSNALGSDPDLYRTYKDNIAMAYKDTALQNGSRESREKLHVISNRAADYFLRLFISK